MGDLGPRILAGQMRLFQDLQADVKAVVKGKSLPAQIQDAFEEMTEGKPHGEILGGK